jgi:hypothetical protein
MIEVALNPQGLQATYLASLNTCFPGWGDAASYGWAFDRSTGGPPADLMIVKENGELLAGSAVTYRVLRTGTGAEGRVGIMTGSWTLPAARGRGCFTRIIEESQMLVRARSALALLAFVTEQNPSYRRLAAAGATLFPTRYLVASPATQLSSDASVELVRPAPGDAARWFSRFEASRSPGAAFAYDAATWESQFLRRASDCSVADAGSLGFCIVEERPDVVRLQAVCPSTPKDRAALLHAMVAWASGRSKKVFFFAPSAGDDTDPPALFAATKGFLTALATDDDARDALVGAGNGLEALAPWSLQSGDRM